MLNFRGVLLHCGWVTSSTLTSFQSLQNCSSNIGIFKHLRLLLLRSQENTRKFHANGSWYFHTSGVINMWNHVNYIHRQSNTLSVCFTTCHSWHKPVEKKRWTHTNTFEGERHPPHGWSFFSRIGWQNPAISTHSPISCRRTPRKKASFTLGVNSCERCGVSKYDGFITVEFLLIYHSNPPSRWHWCCLMPPIQANIIWDNNDT